MRLNQAIQVFRSKSALWHRTRDRAHQLLDPPRSGDASAWEPWNGQLRTFRVIEQDQATVEPPPEEKEVARRYRDVLAPLKLALAEHTDATIMRDNGNRQATADILNPETDEVIWRGVPAFTLIALEKDYAELLTLVKEIPESPPGRWFENSEVGVLESDEVKTLRTEQRRRQTVVVPETARNPAQFDTWSEAAAVAEITTVKRHGGIRPGDKRALIRSVSLALTAIQNAVAEANAAQEVDRVSGAGAALMALALPDIETPTA